MCEHLHLYCSPFVIVAATLNIHKIFSFNYIEPPGSWKIMEARGVEIRTYLNSKRSITSVSKLIINLNFYPFTHIQKNTSRSKKLLQYQSKTLLSLYCYYVIINSLCSLHLLMGNLSTLQNIRDEIMHGLPWHMG